MGWLRSRWTVVALVPAFFLAGFGIVAALAGGSDDPATQGSTAGEDAGPAIVTVIQGTGSTETSSAHGSPTSTGSEGGHGGGGNGGTTTEDGGNGNGNGDGGAPPAPPAGVISVDYGRWEGIFELANSEIVPDFGVASVFGELRYLGGVDCPVGLVRVRAWFYNERGHLVGATVWESVQSTGDGAEVTGREPLPFEAHGQSSEAPASAALRFTAVECL